MGHLPFKLGEAITVCRRQCWILGTMRSSSDDVNRPDPWPRIRPRGRRLLGTRLEEVASPTLGKDHPYCQMGRGTELRFPRRLNGPRREAEARPEIVANPPGPSSYPMALLSCPLETGRSDSLRKRPWARGSPLSGISFNTLVKMGSKSATRNFIFNLEQSIES